MRDPRESVPRTPDGDVRVPGATLVTLCSMLVPDDHANGWRAEWIGELDYAARHGAGAFTLRRRALGALIDALWMRRRHGGERMLSQDLRSAVRTLVRWPGFSAVVVLTLALGIGANAAIFGVVNAVLLRPLPFADPDRLVFVWGRATDGDSLKVGRSSSYPDYLDLRERTRSFSALEAYTRQRWTVTGRGVEPTQVPIGHVSAGFFKALGIAPAAGRGFLAEEDRPGGARVLILSDAFWRTRFAADPRVIGSTLSVEGLPHEVIGVMPRDYDFPAEVQGWVAAGAQDGAELRGRHSYWIVGRLAPGVTAAQATTDVARAAAELEQLHPRENAQRSARVIGMHEAIVGDVRPSLLILMGAVGLVLLVACANIASLFLARTASRAREIAVRTALGAGRGRIARQFFVESQLVTLLGAVLGVLVARAGMRWLVEHAPQQLPRTSGIGLDAGTLLFLLGVTMATGLAFGILPALQITRSAPGAVLREGRGSAGPLRSRLRRGLVVVEVAMAVMLVVGASLLVKSLWRLQRVDPGIDPTGVLAVRLQLPPSRYPIADRPRVHAFYDRLREQIVAAPEVRALAISHANPLEEGWTSSFRIDGRPAPEPGQEKEAYVRPVQPGYFATLKIPMRRGRAIEAGDVEGAPGVVVINESFARQHFPGEDPIGKRILRSPWWKGMPAEFEIVGVSADERFLGPRAEAGPATYFAFHQFTFNEQWILVRTRGEPLAFLPQLRRLVQAMDPDVPVENPQTLEALLGESVADARYNSSLLTLFAGVALLLSAIGIHGLLAQTVAQRSTEMGIRMALGAPRGEVLRLVLGQGMGLTLAGAALGVAGALSLGGVMRRVLDGVQPDDPLVIVGVVALLVLVALVSAWLPARRASRVDPLVALRAD